MTNKLESKLLRSLLKKALDENDYRFSVDIEEKLVQYLLLLCTWNRHFNLTGLCDPKELVYLHIIDSLSIAAYLCGCRILDIGTGAGLPGIPLALLYPHKEWVLLEKNGKKTRFLTQVIAELGLTRVTISHSRAEDFHPPFGFDSILSRAFGSLRQFSQVAEHLLSPKGLLIAMKGRYPTKELEDLPARFNIQKIAPIEIKGITLTRHVVCLQKALLKDEE